MTVEEDAGKRCSECVNDCGGRCRKAMLGVCVCVTVEEDAGKLCSEC